MFKVSVISGSNLVQNHRICVFLYGSIEKYPWYEPCENILRVMVISHKGPVKFYQVPRPGFGKNLPEKCLRPLFSRKKVFAPIIFSEKKSSPPFFELKKRLSPPNFFRNKLSAPFLFLPKAAFT